MLRYLDFAVQLRVKPLQGPLQQREMVRSRGYSLWRADNDIHAGVVEDAMWSEEAVRSISNTVSVC